MSVNKDVDGRVKPGHDEWDGAEMNSNESQESLLSLLVGLELSAITFVRDYLQLQFDGPFINAYVWPLVRTPENKSEFGAPGYRDALCGQIGKTVVAPVEESETKLAICFNDGVVFEISLKREDRNADEAAMFQDGTGKRWNVW